MAVYHISGPSGSGKSTVGRVLAARGYGIVETDFEPGLSAWAHATTREKVLQTPAQPLPKEWVDAHGWFWNPEKMAELIQAVGSEPVFFAGGAHNEKDFFHLFKQRIALIVDGQTLKRRLQPREPQRWVDGSIELQNQLAWNKKFETYSLSTGAILVDSSVSPEEVANHILLKLGLEGNR